MKQQAFVHRNLPRLLLQAREAVMTHTRPSLREHGLSDQQWRVLRVLGAQLSADTIALDSCLCVPRRHAVTENVQALNHATTEPP